MTRTLEGVKPGDKIKERPILFQGAMVRALLDGTKSQTRRLVKPQPGHEWAPIVGLYHPTIIDKHGDEAPGPEIFGASDEQEGRKSPYGKPGDRIAVRETFFAYGRWVTRYSEKKKRDEWHFIDMTAECDRAYQYDANSPEVPLATGRGGALPGWYKRPAIFMPRVASRILLEIVSVRVERLNDCSDEDARAEGCTCYVCGGKLDGRSEDDCHCFHRKADASDYRNLWESINGAGSWAANPWIWRIEFRRITP